MAYLASKRVVHRDLAARNVVLSEHYTIAKVTDFGLTRKAEFCYRMRNSGRVSLKGMALKSVCEKILTTKSDVSSFGVVLRELLSSGETPTTNIPNDEFLKVLRNGMMCMTGSLIIINMADLIIQTRALG
nr:hypothetical transcript [Hymenolepis microstoma]